MNEANQKRETPILIEDGEITLRIGSVLRFSRGADQRGQTVPLVAGIITAKDGQVVDVAADWGNLPGFVEGTLTGGKVRLSTSAQSYGTWLGHFDYQVIDGAQIKVWRNPGI
jgi:hypothetical protein